MKILSVFGTRPEAIKMAPLVHALNGSPSFESLVCVTAQHRQMLDQVLEAFEIEPDYDLDIMRPNQNLNALTTSIMELLQPVLSDSKPDMILVHGDTTTAFAASVASFYAGIPVGHIEAGLRSYDLYSPFPEEFNRRVVSTIARLHFAPTETSRQNLLKEGVRSDTIFVTGNTVIDSLLMSIKRIDSNPALKASVTTKLDSILSFKWRSCRYVLVTGHRRENFGKGLLEICKALSKLALVHPDVQFVYPVHLNPSVREPVFRLLGNMKNISLIEPLEYYTFITLLNNCYVVLTDSGGIQEEAPSLGKPVLVMRELTERPEAVISGSVKLVGASAKCIASAMSSLLDNRFEYDAMARANNPYGNGDACNRILKILETR